MTLTMYRVSETCKRIPGFVHLGCVVNLSTDTMSSHNSQMICGKGILVTWTK